MRENKQIKIRDLIALPFAIMAFIFLFLTITIGGVWTSEILLITLLTKKE